jgi:membrane protease YdiL (CAAX protease family)
LGPKEIGINSLGWFVYLFAYEFMCRSLLLTACYHYWSFWPAVAINLLFYSSIHIAKGLRETFLAFPFGLLLCYVRVSTGSLAFAISTHFILAISTDYYSVYHNPEMKFSR